MTETATSRYDVAEHLRTREDMAAYLEGSIEEADGDAAFVAKALATSPALGAWRRWQATPRPLPREPLQGAVGEAQDDVRSRPAEGNQGAVAGLNRRGHFTLNG